MFIQIFTRLFKWRPKPLTHNQYANVLNDNYQISSEHPTTLTYKESGYLLVKAVGKVYIFCNGVLVLRLKHNTSLITIGWIGNKTQILDIKHNFTTSSHSYTSSNSNTHSTTTITSYTESSSSSSSSGSGHRSASHHDNYSSHTSSSDSGSCDSGGDSGGGSCD